MAVAVAVSATLSLRRGARGRAGPRRRRLGGARRRAAAGMVGERREEVAVGGGWRLLWGSPPSAFTEHPTASQGPQLSTLPNAPPSCTQHPRQDRWGA